LYDIQDEEGDDEYEEY